MARITIPFGTGVREDVDPKVMPDGALKRVENLRLTREGRLVLRYGYTAIALTSQRSFNTSLLNLKPYDLASYDGRLLAIGKRSGVGGGTLEDIYDYVDEPRYKWRSSSNDQEQRLCPVTNLRDVPGIAAFSSSADRIDVAAGGGRVCLVYNVSSSVVGVWIADAETHSLLLEQSILNLTAPRVVAVGSVFYIAGIASAGTSVPLYRYDPSADDQSFTALTDAYAAGAAVSLMDMEENEAGDGFSVAIARNATPAVTIKRFSSAGAAVQTITGPAAVMTQIAVFEQAARVHLVAVETADTHVDLYTYAISSGLIENTTLNLASSLTTVRQPSVNALSATLTVAFQDAVNADVVDVVLDASTHTLASTTTEHRQQLNSKLASNAAWGAAFYATLIAESTTTFAHCLMMSYSGNVVGAFIDRGIAAAGHANTLPSLAKDLSTGKFYWARLVNDGDDRTRAVMTEFEVGSTARRQTCVIDGQLLIAGGVVQRYAGRHLVEAAYPSRPVIITATPSNGAGSLTPSALYAVSCIYEWYDETRRLHQSEPSDVTEVTMGVADDTITLSVQGPLTGRLDGTEASSSLKIISFQSLAAPDKQLLRAANANSNNGQALLEQSLTLTLSDTDLSDEASIYTQASSGARSGPNAFVSPQPASAIWASASRVLTAQLPNDYQIQESRPPFPNEPISWAENLGGFGAGPERMLAVASLDERRIGWSGNGIYEWSGEGLDINGVGDLGSPRRLPSLGGLYGGATPNLAWRSIVETSIGIFFQLASDSIFLIPRGGGAPVFVGAPVQDTLALYPVITSATYLKNSQVVCFTCNDAGATDSVILVYDIGSEQWFVDTDTTALLSSCEYQGRLVILRANNTIELQDAAYPPSSFLTATIETGTLYPFGKGGEGQIDEIQLFAEFLGACNVVLSLSFDDGATYPVTLTKAVSAASALPIKWGPNQMRGDRVRLKFHTTTLSGSTAQIAWNFATVDFTARNRSALRTTTQKG